ncbi:hypothetical protein CANARDRAFT_30745 [[Candida] arabinofermentans NRRL YB-2248]|uniref:nicotinamidase n=1 Tax=[Candida] arabinofermentans NRRL YB-2248 TaxID=983967 RepID=A0A1E4SST6_9ASCO|nr:hypothetical protein CANARDRAFT_30745 [[Candida] arabinofermentans NRRL YB-2248]
MSQLNSFNPALIIVDLQEDFLPPTGSLAVSEGRSIIPSILQLLDISKYHWKAIIATKDWHPINHTSFASNHDEKPYTLKTFNYPLKGNLETKEQVLWPDHCIQDTFGSTFPEEFQTKFDELIDSNSIPITTIKKGYLQDREYYSCFQDTWKLHHTECEKYLKDNDITHVFTVGIAYDYCVLNSSIDSSDLGFKTFVLKDCSKSVYPENDIETDKIYEKNGVKIISMDSPELNGVMNC